MGKAPTVRQRGGQHYPIIEAIEGYAERALGAEVDLQRFLKATAAKRALAALGREDIIQESLFTVLNVAQHYDDQRGQTPGPYILRALANNALNLNQLEQRHWSTRHQEALDYEGDQQDVLSAVPDTESPDPAQMAERLESIQQVRAMLAELPPSLNRLFKLLYVEDLTQREASERLGISQARVAQLHRDLLNRGKAYFGLSEMRLAA
jgi:RNA polymerase sigma factor (sigma-70 family)